MKNRFHFTKKSLLVWILLMGALGLAGKAYWDTRILHNRVHAVEESLIRVFVTQKIDVITPDAIADYVYTHSEVENTTALYGEDGGFIFASGLFNKGYCGGFANVFNKIATAFGYRTRTIQLVGTNPKDTHILNEVWEKDRWVAIDPSFNCTYACLTCHKQRLSVKAVKNCLAKRHTVKDVPGAHQTTDRSWDSYCISLAQLVHKAYVYRSSVMNGQPGDETL